MVNGRDEPTSRGTSRLRFTLTLCQAEQRQPARKSCFVNQPRFERQDAKQQPVDRRGQRTQIVAESDQMLVRASRRAMTTGKNRAGCWRTSSAGPKPGLLSRARRAPPACNAARLPTVKSCGPYSSGICRHPHQQPAVRSFNTRRTSQAPALARPLCSSTSSAVTRSKPPHGNGRWPASAPHNPRHDDASTRKSIPDALASRRQAPSAASRAAHPTSSSRPSAGRRCAQVIRRMPAIHQ